MRNKAVKAFSAAILISIGLTACNSKNTTNNDAVEVMAEIESATEETTEMESSIVEESSITEIESTIVEESSIVETTEIESTIVEESSITETTKENTYTITALSQTMYATSNCRIRKGPSTEDEVTRTLDKGQSVQVTGKVNEVNWYEIETDNGKGYISGSLLSEREPVVSKAPQNPQTQNPQPETSTPAPSTETPAPNTDTFAPPINPNTGEPLKPGESYVAPNGVEEFYGGNSSDRYNAK